MPTKVCVRLEGPGAGAFQHANGLRTLVLRRLAAADRELAGSLRAESCPRPYSLGPLMSENGCVTAHSFEIRLLEDALLEPLQIGLRRDGPEVHLGRSVYTLRGWEVTQHHSWAELSAPPPRGWEGVTLQLGSPTAHRIEGPSRRCAVLPDPFRYWHGWLDRWNRTAPEALRLPESVLECVRLRAAVAHCQGGTQRAALEPGVFFVGFVGEVRFTLVQAEQASALELAALAALARFAEYSGTGADTQRGMGVTLPVTPSRPRREMRRTLPEATG